MLSPAFTGGMVRRRRPGRERDLYPTDQDTFLSGCGPCPRSARPPAPGLTTHADGLRSSLRQQESIASRTHGGGAARRAGLLSWAAGLFVANTWALGRRPGKLQPLSLRKTKG